MYSFLLVQPFWYKKIPKRSVFLAILPFPEKWPFTYCPS